MNKDHQHFLFYGIRKVDRAKRWLHWIAPLITSMEEVLAFVRALRAARRRLGIDRRCAPHGYSDRWRLLFRAAD